MCAEALGFQAIEASNMLKAMSNPKRLQLLCHLASGERSVTQLINMTGFAQSIVSRHLRYLREFNLVNGKRDGHNMIYSLNGTGSVAVIETLYGLYCRVPGERCQLREKAA